MGGPYALQYRVHDTEFIKDCVAAGAVFWSYHSNMRLAERSIPREDVVASVEGCEIIEDYPSDRPLPSCLCLGKDRNGGAIHYVIAIDRAGHDIRFVTVYRPDPTMWEGGFRRRRPR